VRKSSVYLPEGLKRRLAARAATSGRSEAELIRAAIESSLAHDAPAPVPADPPVPGRLVGVGVGPGPADLVTVRALVALRRADRVVAPCTSLDAVGRAELIVRQAAPDVAVDRLVFVMAADHAARIGALEEVCDTVAAHLAAGEEVAFVTLGDPNVYSTFSTVAAGVRARRPATVVESVPGVMAFQALAAGAGVPLTDEQQSLLLLAANSDDADLDDALAEPTRAVVLYKGGRRLPAVAAHLERAGRLDGAVLGELLGMPGERVVPVKAAADRPASYLSSIIVPACAGAGPVPRRRSRARARRTT
jgi:precorrin-2/cobalt-factor-2 C20-methyltransferase